MTQSTSSPRPSRSPAPFDRTKLRDALYKVKYDGHHRQIQIRPSRSSAERHDSILPTHYKLLAYHQRHL
jgi:hypothetical protein